MVVRLIKKHPWLTLNKSYIVIGIESDYYRILDDSLEPYLYPPDLFETIDSQRPNDWIVKFGPDGDESAYPKQMSRVGFFEDYFERNPHVIKMFWDYVDEVYGDLR